MKKKHIEQLLDGALEMYEEEMDKKEELQNRIDKAIEYIKAVGVRPKEIDSFVLLNILKGEQ